MNHPKIITALVPFGLRTSDGQFLDAYEVAAGRNCDCTCPSCKTPLIARQGAEKRWHFAHASQGVYESTTVGCEYSYYVSVRMMARQIVGQDLQLCLPEYKGTVSQENYSGIPIPEEFLITPSRRISISSVEVEAKFGEVSVDVLGRIRDFDFVLYFTHPGRAVPYALLNPKSSSCGIVAVCLTATEELFETSTGQTYREVLSRFLDEDTGSKTWIYHPRYEKEKATAEKKLATRISEMNKVLRNRPDSRRTKGL